VSRNPAQPEPGVALCRLDELADPGARGFSFREDTALFFGFVVRTGDEVRGYVDSCPHAGWRLAGMSDNYLTRDERHLLCSGHGALFRLDDGECVAGPCFGDKLETWAVRIEDGVVTTAPQGKSKEPPYWGGCRCAAVRYQVTAPAINVRACHCRSCQKATSAPFLVRAIFPAASLHASGPLIRYRSSARLARAFCPTCGTLLFGEPIDRPEFVAVATLTLDDPNALPPQMHIWTSEMVDWLKLDDGLPRFKEGAP
jgi:nitrite reductase/ring-hydroxylating ferredoxin subunit